MDEKPKYDISSQIEYYCFIYYKEEMDEWINKLIMDYEDRLLRMREKIEELQSSARSTIK